jgi:hypothetical protein
MTLRDIVEAAKLLDSTACLVVIEPWKGMTRRRAPDKI